MRKKVYIIAFLLTASFMSCKEEVLLEDPKALTVEAFYNTSAEVQAALAAIYAPIRTPLSGVYISSVDQSTEWGAAQTGNPLWDGLRSFKGMDAVGAASVEGVWNALYVAIRNANLVIKNTPNSTLLTTVQKDQFVAEARFMRALCYFYLVRHWGGVPLYTEATLDQTSGVAKVARTAVFDHIVNDLKFAETNGYDTPPLVGKPSKIIAKALLADVYFFQGLNSDASKKAEEVILANKFSLVKTTVSDDFNKVFGIGANSTEEVFYLKFNATSPSQLILYTQLIANSPWFATAGFGVTKWHASAKFYIEWPNADLRKSFTWYPSDSRTGNNWVPGQPAFPSSGVQLLGPKKWNAPGVAQSAFDMPIYRYAEILLLYAEASARAANTVSADAITKLNMVHRRAYGFDPLAVSPVDFKASDFATVASFTDQVIKERAYEFMLEGKRFLDLVRSGKLKTEIKANIGIDVVDKAILWPIPAAEFQLNEALKPADQNPGY